MLGPQAHNLFLLLLPQPLGRLWQREEGHGEMPCTIWLWDHILTAPDRYNVSSILSTI